MSLHRERIAESCVCRSSASLLRGALVILILGIFPLKIMEAAEIYARKMEIVRTPSGPATVFRDSVNITQDGTVLVSRRAFLQENAGIAVLADSVFIQTPDAWVWADSVVYQFSAKKATLFSREPGQVLVRVAQVKGDGAERGTGDVEVRARELEYLLDEGVIIAVRGLELKNLTGDYLLQGAHGIYNLKQGEGVVDSLPVLTIYSTESNKTSASGKELVVITARRMTFKEKEQIARAEGDVFVRSGGSGADADTAVASLSCDTALFYAGADSGIAWGNPFVKDSVGQAEGDTVLWTIADGELRRVAIVGDATGRYRTEGGNTVIVKGTELSLMITDGRIERIEVERLVAGQLVRPSGQKLSQRER